MTRPPFVDHCLELLGRQAKARRMFGAHGLYVDDLFVAIVAGDDLYLKADAEAAGRFAAAGGRAFSYVRQGRQMTLGFWTPPAEALDSAAAMQPWLQLALRAAVAARGRR